MSDIRKARVKAHLRQTRTGVAQVIEHERKDREGLNLTQQPYQRNLFDMATIQAVKTINERKEKQTIETDPEKIAEAINTATPETRNEKQIALFGKPEPEESIKQEEKEYTFDPKVKHNILTGVNERAGTVLDYSKIDLKKIGRVKFKRGEEPPQWLPKINIRNFTRSRNSLVYHKLDEGLLYVEMDIDLDAYKSRTEKREQYAGTCAIMPMELAVITEEYYRDKRRDYNKEYAEKFNDAFKMLDVKIKKAKRLKTLQKGKTTWEHVLLWERITGKTFLGHSREYWEYYLKADEEVRQKMIDVNCQNDENESSFSKGRETSYGRKGSKKTLLDKYGVLIKRQNGDEITKEETDQIEKALKDVYSVFGDRSEMSRKFNLLISHAGNKRQHASTYVGLFFPTYHAIGVSWLSNTSSGMTLAHEFAHFMDYWLADKIGRRSGWYASDDWESLPGQIEVSDYTQNLDGGGFLCKDFRSLKATQVATEMVNRMRPPKNMKEYKKMVREVAKGVAKELNNTPAVALKSYINPAIFAEWKISAGVE